MRTNPARRVIERDVFGLFGRLSVGARSRVLARGGLLNPTFWGCFDVCPSARGRAIRAQGRNMNEKRRRDLGFCPSAEAGGLPACGGRRVRAGKILALWARRAVARFGGAAGW